MARFPAMPFFCESFLADTDHLTDAESGLYIRLLAKLWLAPRQRFPDDDAWLARKFRKTVEQVRSELRPLLVEFFKSDGGRIYHARIDKEFQHVCKVTSARRGSAKARWDKDKASCERNAHTLTLTPTLIKKDSSPSEAPCEPSPEVAGTGPAGDILLSLPADERYPAGASMAPLVPSPEPEPKPEREPKGFHEWWAGYPKKVGRREAAKAFGRALKRATAHEISAGLVRAIKRWESSRTEPKFVPNPSTWLNQDRWLDEPGTVAAKPFPDGRVRMDSNAKWQETKRRQKAEQLCLEAGVNPHTSDGMARVWRIMGELANA